MAELETGSALPNLSDQQKLAWLRLIRSDNVGPVTFRDLINMCGSAEEAIAQVPQLMAKAKPKKAIRLCTEEAAEREYEAVRNRGWHFVAKGEAAYPKTLTTFASAPPLLAVAGNISALAKPSVSIVGSRNASANGIAFTRQIAGHLAGADLLITSGFARGIDTAAHQAALNKGATAAVFAGGLDVLYPPENSELADAIFNNEGCLLSEMPLGWKPRAVDFPRRNRIVAGLSLATLVIEANPRAGSLITARLANEMGRLVFAVPGSPLDPRAKGANLLLKD